MDFKKSNKRSTTPLKKLHLKNKHCSLIIFYEECGLTKEVDNNYFFQEVTESHNQEKAELEGIHPPTKIIEFKS